MSPIRFLEEKLHFLAPLFAAILMIDYLLINILLQFNDPTWWSDGKPDDLDFYASLLETGTAALLLFSPFMFARLAVTRGLVLRIAVALAMMPGVLVCLVFMVPFHITAFFDLLFLFALVLMSLAFGLFLQILQMHAVMWGADRASAGKPHSVVRAAITLSYVGLGGLALIGWMEFS